MVSSPVPLSVDLVTAQYQQSLTAVGDSLALTAALATLPLLTVFVCLGVLKLKAQWAGLAGVAVALAVAVLGMGMPLGLGLLSAAQGAAFGVFPIMWIVIAALWLYQLTVVSGRFEDLRSTFAMVSDDPRIQAVIIAFCFGGLLEALAGFGAPVAISGLMLLALGIKPLRAAVTVLLANTAPVAFGALAIPIIVAGNLTDIPVDDLGAIVGRQTPLLAMFVPLLLVGVIDGLRGMREVWPAALVTGGSFALAQFLSSNFFSVELTDVVAALVALGATVVFLRVWQPRGTAAAIARITGSDEDQAVGSTGAGRPVPSGRPVPAAQGGAQPSGTTTAVDDDDAARAAVSGPRPTAGQVWMALFPYLLVVGVFAVAKLVAPVKELLALPTFAISWPGLDGAILSTAGDPIAATYSVPLLETPGTLIFLSGVVVAAVYRIPARVAAAELGMTVYRLRFAILTVASVLALAFVMNSSAQTVALGTWIAGAAGAAFPFIAPVLGWIGVAVTGSDTSANALFATLQKTAAAEIGADPGLLVAANTTGGVVGKMISPQNLVIAAAAVGLAGREPQIFRKVLPWSILLLVVLCLLIGLQSTTVLSWMLP
jgi:lactate permease